MKNFINQIFIGYFLMQLTIEKRNILWVSFFITITFSNIAIIESTLNGYVSK